MMAPVMVWPRVHTKVAAALGLLPNVFIVGVLTGAPVQAIPRRRWRQQQQQKSHACVADRPVLQARSLAIAAVITRTRRPLPCRSSAACGGGAGGGSCNSRHDARNSARWHRQVARRYCLLPS